MKSRSVIFVVLLLSAAAVSFGQAQPASLDWVKARQLAQIDPNLTGKGVRIGAVTRSCTYIDSQPQNDYRPDLEHGCFTDSNVFFHSNGDDVDDNLSDHATAIISLLVGSDANAYHPELGEFTYLGVAPEANVNVFEFWHFLTDYVFSANSPPADVLTMSVGSQFEDWWTRGIESMAQRFGLLVVAGIGNGSEAHDPVLYPAAAGNVLGVGVIDSVDVNDTATTLTHFVLPNRRHSSSGPSSEGRCKPDIVAPGNSMAAVLSEPGRYEPTGDYSSFAAPIVAGTAGLLIQKAKSQPDLAPAVAEVGGNCVMKSILMNSATKLPYWHKGKLDKSDDHIAALDFVQGAGLLNAEAAYELLTAGRGKPGRVEKLGWDNNVLKTKNIYRIEINEPQSEFITATLVWNQRYSNEYPFELLGCADLRIELWAVDGNDPNKKTIIDYSDSKNDNVEHIYFKLDAEAEATKYEIIVSSNDDSNDTTPSTNYALSWSLAPNKSKDQYEMLWYDLNSDGTVDIEDARTVMGNSSKEHLLEQNCLGGDINMDGKIGSDDLKLLADYIKHQGS